jgi:hypothetical protein
MKNKIKRLENVANTLFFITLIGLFGLVGRIEYDTEFGINSFDFSFFACLALMIVFLYIGYTLKTIIRDYKEQK